ncbi:MAG: dipeptidase [Bacteroidota bacterium]
MNPLRLPLFAALGLLGLAMCSSAPEPAAPPPPSQPIATAADTLAPRDGGAVRLGEPARSRLLAEDTLWARALALHYDAIVTDGHIDTPSLMLDDGYDFGKRHTPRSGSHHVDLPKMIEGGLDAPFFSIYVSRTYGETPEATDRALAMLAEAKRQVEVLDGIELATSAGDVVRITRAGGKAILLGLEGGHALQASKVVLRRLADEGIRYVTLTHTNTNSWADAASDAIRWNGLNDAGRAFIREMNRLGVLVDLSHVADATFYDALDATRAPVILSHSSVRALNPHPRNVTDPMLRALRENGGVIMINFYSRYVAQGGQPATLTDILDHIDHAVEVAGIDHVGLGSDFDGVPFLPRGMGDATRLPHITYGLLKRGYSDDDVRKILGVNTLRVLADADRIAAEMREEDGP